MDSTRILLNSRASAAYRGMWIALDNCRYDDSTGKPVEGDVVDADRELSQLCARMKQSGHCSCAILFCDENTLLERSPESERGSVASDYYV